MNLLDLLGKEGVGDLFLVLEIFFFSIFIIENTNKHSI